MTLLTPTLRLQLAATAAMPLRFCYDNQPPPPPIALGSRPSSTSGNVETAVPNQPPLTVLSCSTSPCFHKPTFQAIPFHGPTYPILIGHVDEPDATPLLEWLPYCKWDGTWKQYACGHYSTLLSVPYHDIDHTVRTLVAAGWKQHCPLHTFSLFIDDNLPDYVTARLHDHLHCTALRELMPWIAYSGVRVMRQSALTCERHDLHRTLSALYELGFGERPPDVKGGREVSESGSNGQRWWSSAALLRGRDGRKRGVERELPRTGSVSKGEGVPLIKRSRVKTGSFTSDSNTSCSTSATVDESPAVAAPTGAEVKQLSAADERKEVVEDEEEGDWVVVDAASLDAV